MPPESALPGGDDLVARDRRCVMHPYAAPISSAPLFAVERAEGVRLTLTDGRELIDGMASWWAAIHGYAHPALTAAISAQLGRMSHVMFGGLTHAPAVELCETLVALTPEPLTRVFLADSGSVSVEVAIKLALQFFIAQGQPEKRRLISALAGYHGDTFGAMAATDPVNGMHHLFRGALAQHLFAEAPGPAFDAPWSPDALSSMAALLERHAHEVAAVILEPIAQNAGGMRFYHPQYLRELRALCDRHGVLLIFDEIATNFGRTGELFGCNHAGVAPDIMCLGKALTGGMMTLAATLCTERVAATIAGNEPRVFMHGPTYMGNPLACSAALASVRLLLASPWRARVSAIEAQLRRELAPCRALDAVADVRVLGAIGVVELKQPVDTARVQPAFVERGVWLRPFGKLVYTMPPYIIEPTDLSRISEAIVGVVSGI
ncbi:adenosylmethionine--8-amino-7-oxononanoate transaminase [Sorangium sp. So ce204]|uniref:adenosylmethionine--8-amino-7-oxononanoate transaminase n=1 Tax=Sorangium sp. So ce204 TaxID=3133288 RepID=UPI003F5E144D